MDLNKSDYIAWRDAQVTEAFRLAMIEEIETKVASLIRFAGDNPQQDKFNAGFIQGVQWLLDWEPTFIEEIKDGIDSEGSQDSY